MYTRSRSSGGGPGFGRGQMNTGNGNSFQSPNPYNNPQVGNYMQSNYKPGMIQPSAPFKPSGPPLSHQDIKSGPQQNVQATSTPMAPRLKPILKQSTLSPVVGSAPVNPTTGNAQVTATPSPVPPPSLPSTTANTTASSSNAAAAAQASVNKAPGSVNATGTPVTKTESGDGQADESGNKALDSTATGQEPIDSNDPHKWAEDDQGKWVDGGDEQGGQWMDTEDGQERRKWRRFKKVSGSKPNKKLKRLRMNQRLRKALMPKNAIMVLNEMKAGVQFTFPETQAIMPNSLFLVHAELEGKVYVGQGLSKPLARQNAAENALKCLLLEKMTAAAAIKERVDSEGDTVMEQQPASGEATAAPVKDENGEETTEETEDVPWSSLASFALYKLFLEWQNQGTVVPIPRPGVAAPTKNRAESKPSGERLLPPNANEIHPVMLLNQMRPGTTYTEVGRVGTPPNIQFTLGVEINGTTYTGSAKNKKDAKKLAAKEALKALYNLDYPEEIRIDNPDGSQ